MRHPAYYFMGVLNYSTRYFMGVLNYSLFMGVLNYSENFARLAVYNNE